MDCLGNKEVGMVTCVFLPLLEIPGMACVCEYVWSSYLLTSMLDYWEQGYIFTEEKIGPTFYL